VTGDARAGTQGPGHRSAVTALAGASAALLALRLVAAGRVGFGDSEALYASYALHPQPAYLDHPGLVGLVARLIGGGTAPSPLRAHAVTAILATAFPWMLALACRAAGASWRRAWVAALVAALAPEIAVGLFALTPDLLLALAWTCALALAAMALRSAPGSSRAALGFAGAGLLAGLAAASKVTGLTLFVALAGAYASRPARAHARSTAPWAGLAAGALVVAPVLLFEAHSGWPMLRHRLVDTQATAGLSLRNTGALVGGQLLYLSPLVAWLAALAAREVWRGRGDAAGSLLAWSFAAPAAALLPLCLWSRVAEPHWLAPAFLALVPAAARAPWVPSRRLVMASCALAGVLVAAIHAWVLIPSAVRLAPASYDPRLDLGNELLGWPEVVAVVREEAAAVAVDEPSDAPWADLAVAGPHWVICAQLEAALRDQLRVGCDTPIPDDFDTWWPRDRWRAADLVIWVSDARFGPPLLPTHRALRSRQVRIERDGRAVRIFTVTVLASRAQA
jgi:Dolichyl-phosphate-mannose-protein mannosyltransferase